jgi:hypothetical protein
LYHPAAPTATTPSLILSALATPQQQYHISAVTPRRQQQQEGNSTKRIEAQKTLEAKLINRATSSATPALWIHVTHYVSSLEPHQFSQLHHWTTCQQHHHVIPYCHISCHII